jgi:uncharacterized protein
MVLKRKDFFRRLGLSRLQKENKMNTLDQFSKKQYLSLETFRRSGAGVKTPVWFCQMEDSLYIMTGESSGKVKRIHNDCFVNVAPCKRDGTPTGNWSPAQARHIVDPETIEKVNRLMDKKYGLLKKLFRLDSSNSDRPTAILEIKLVEAETK